MDCPGQPILVRTGALRRAVTGGSGLQVDIQQHSLKMTITIPTYGPEVHALRPVCGLTERDGKAITEMLQDRIEKEMKRRKQANQLPHQKKVNDTEINGLFPYRTQP